MYFILYSGQHCTYFRTQYALTIRIASTCDNLFSPPSASSYFYPNSCLIEQKQTSFPHTIVVQDIDTKTPVRKYVRSMSVYVL